MKSEEFLREIDFMRSHVRPNESGVVFFDLGAFLNYAQHKGAPRSQPGGRSAQRYSHSRGAIPPGSLDCNKLKNVKSEEFLREIDFMRSHVRPFLVFRH